MIGAGGLGTLDANADVGTGEIVVIDRDVVDCTEEVGDEDVGSVTGKDRVALDQNAVLAAVDLYAVIVGITPGACKSWM